MKAYDTSNISCGIVGPPLRRKERGLPSDTPVAGKEAFCDFRHRALRHHSLGVFEAERVFGLAIRNSDGRDVPIRYVVEQHIKEDCGGIVPSVSDWLSRIRPETWMSRGYSLPIGDPPARDP